MIGSYNHTIDPKGRVFIPAKWRDELTGGFVLTRGMDGSIFGLPLSEWERLSAKMATIPLSDTRAQSVQRSLTRWAHECDLDKQGRVVVPARLREDAEIGSEAELIGMINHFEIWSPTVLAAKDAREGNDYEDNLSIAAEWGI